MRGEALQTNYEVNLCGKSGRVIDCRLNITAVQWAGENAPLAVFEEATAEKAMDAELHHLASMDRLTALASRAN